jgi:hypothetical protein
MGVEVRSMDRRVTSESMLFIVGPVHQLILPPTSFLYIPDPTTP